MMNWLRMGIKSLFSFQSPFFYSDTSNALHELTSRTIQSFDGENKQGTGHVAEGLRVFIYPKKYKYLWGILN